MKRSAALLLVTATILAADGTFLLPHRWQDARHALTETIKAAPEQIILVTDAVDDRYLRRALRTALERGKQLVLITGSQKTAAQWAMYRRVSACLLPAEAPLEFSLLVTDAPAACMVTLPLSTDALRERYGLVRCTDADLFAGTVQTLRQECRDYFGE